MVQLASIIPRLLKVSPEDWAALIGGQPHPPVVVAQTYHRDLDGSTYPVLLSCDDGHDYAVKGPRAPGRSLVSEALICAAGSALGAPVPKHAWVNVPEVLIAWQREMAHFDREGLYHGSLWITGCTDALPLQYVDEPGNRERLALLRVLYSWVGAADRQLIYLKQPPHHVFSVDHNHFFPGGPLWTIEDLEDAAAASWDPFFDCAGLDGVTRETARAILNGVTVERVAGIVAAPHDSWGYSMQERIATAEYLVRRQTELLALPDY